jgi:hypothetical protein
MTTARFLRAFGAGFLIGLRAAVLYLLAWPVWSVITAVIWLLSIWFGAWFALLVILCPGERLKEQLINHSQFWFKK